jgi:chlorite dismutase
MADTSYHFYAFFNATDAFRRLSAEERGRAEMDFHALLTKKQEGVAVDCYLTTGFRPDSTFMLWVRAESVEKGQDFLRRATLGPLGTLFSLSHTLFGMPRPSHYGTNPSKQAIDTEDPKRAPFLVVYPFTKTKEWHLLSMDERKRMMGSHIGVGRQHPDISQLLLYGYGVSDYEFIVSYETDSLEKFQSLVMDLRATEARLYTLVDTPIFVCSHRTPEKLSEELFSL